MKKLKEILRVTAHEKKVLIFLLVTAVASFGIHLYDNNNEVEYKEYDYSKTDTVFNHSETVNPQENVEKNVDSEHELLDLRVSDNKYKNNKSKLLAAKSININTANKKTLMSLPGIGSKTADAIISYREKNGFFVKLSDLRKVKGIGSKKFKKIEKYINLK
ncbi:MAG: ComEA family DNA-binding protein [Rhodothermaceae bacterium]